MSPESSPDFYMTNKQKTALYTGGNRKECHGEKIYNYSRSSEREKLQELRASKIERQGQE